MAFLVFGLGRLPAYCRLSDFVRFSYLVDIRDQIMTLYNNNPLLLSVLTGLSTSAVPFYGTVQHKNGL